jgi:DNA polymerase III gamma/tau subunit
MGLAGNRKLVELLKEILSHDSASALQLFQQIWMDGKEPAVFLGELNALLRDVMIVKAAGAGADDLISGNYEREDLNSFASRMTGEEILHAADTMQNALSRIRMVRSPRTVAELCIVSLCDDRLADSVGALRARISKLEAERNSGIPLHQEPASLAEPEPPPKSEAETIPDETERPVPEEIAPEKKTVTQEPRHSEISVPSGDAVSGFTPDDAAKRILQEARMNLPIEVRFAVDDPARFRIQLRDQDLILEAVPGFLFDRMKRPEIRNVFSSAAQQVTGNAVAVQVQELKQGQRVVRDLNELKQFPEVSFLS